MKINSPNTILMFIHVIVYLLCQMDQKSKQKKLNIKITKKVCCRC